MPPGASWTTAKLAAGLRVSGPDAVSFLQGQFSNDLGGAGPGTAVYGLWLNQKGRVLADSFVLAREDGAFDVWSAASPAAEIRARLEAYLVADEVEIEDRTTGLVGWVLAGDAAAGVFASWGIEAPPPGRWAAGDGAIVFRARRAGPAWHVVAPVAAADRWQARLEAASARGLAVPADAAAWETDRVRAGIPVVPLELGPGDLPAEGGLDAEAVSFTKGCYLGQEVMARLRNLGQVRRRLFVVSGRQGPGERLPAAGPLFAGGRAIGELRSAFRDADGFVGLAMLQVNGVKPGDRLATDAGGEPAVQVERVAEGRTW